MFVLLEHRTSPETTGAGVHWDFMIELPGQERLASWRLERNPLDAGGPVAAERIGDHRRMYLDYEGAIAGGRGTVRRLDCGESNVLHRGGDAIVFELKGSRLRGIFELRPSESGLVLRAARV
jgi:hypothetical protein